MPKVTFMRKVIPVFGGYAFRKRGVHALCFLLQCWLFCRQKGRLDLAALPPNGSAKMKMFATLSKIVPMVCIPQRHNLQTIMPRQTGVSTLQHSCNLLISFSKTSSALRPSCLPWQQHIYDGKLIMQSKIPD